MKRTVFAKTLSVLLSALMVFSLFGGSMTALAAIGGVPTRTDVDSYFADQPLYGAERWDKTTGLSTLTFRWDAYSGSIGYNPKGGSLVFAYPSHIYLNVGETLEGAGYMGHMTAQYGDNSGDVTDFRVMLSSATWGESTRAGFSPVSELISGYGHQGTCTEGSKLMTGSSSHYDFSNDGRGSDQIIKNKAGDNENFDANNESIVVWRNNDATGQGLYDEYVLLTGTAAKAGEVTFDPTTNFTIGAAQRYTAFAWHSDNGTRFNRSLMTGGSRPQTAPEEDALSITFTVYDKSELNTLIEAADSGSYTLQEGQTPEQFAAALAAAKAVRANREVSQDEIDAAAAAIGDKMTLLINANAPGYDAAASVSAADAVFNETVYHFADEATDAYQSVVYAPEPSNVENEATSYTQFKFDNCYYRVYMPTNTVLVYTGQEEDDEPRSPIMMGHVGDGSNNSRAIYYLANATAGTKLPFQNFWVGYKDGSNNNRDYLTDLDKLWANAGSNAVTFNGTVVDSDFSMTDNQGNKNTWRNYWNYFRYTGTGDTTAYYEKFDSSNINLSLRHYWKAMFSDDNTYNSDDNAGMKIPGTVYVLNFKPVYEKLADAAAVKEIIEGSDAWMYTEASVKRAKATIAAMLKANPNRYAYAGDVNNQVVACANAISEAAYMLAHDGLTLEKKEGTVTFVSQTGETLLINGAPASYTKEYGENIAANEIPQLSSVYFRQDNAQWDYGETLSWEPAIEGNSILVDAPEKIYRINDTAAVQSYTVNFYDEDGTTLLVSAPWQYGDYPDFGGTVIKQNGDEAVVAAPTKQDYDNNYTVTGWTDGDGAAFDGLNTALNKLEAADVAASSRDDLSGDKYTKYTAVYTAVPRTDADYTAYDAALAAAEAVLADPALDSAAAAAIQSVITTETARAHDAMNRNFRSDDEAGVAAIAAAAENLGRIVADYTDGEGHLKDDYVAVFTVVWKNADGAILETDENVPYGAAPEYNGTTPTRQDAVNVYYSDGWTPAVASVTGDAEYTATYNATDDEHVVPIVYTVSFDVPDGVAPIEAVSAGYGQQITLPAPALDGFSFDGWFTDSEKENAVVLSDDKYTVTETILLYAKFTKQTIEAEAIANDVAALIAGVADGTGALNNPCYTAETAAAYESAKAAAEAFAGMDATAANLAAYAAAKDALAAAVAALAIEHNYTHAPETLVSSTAPSYDPATGEYTDGEAVYRCANDAAHPTETVAIHSADYSKPDGYSAVADDAAKLPAGNPELTDEAAAAIEAIVAALGAIPTDLAAAEQQTLDDAVAALKAELDAFKEAYLAKDGDTFITDGGSYVPNDGATKTYTVAFETAGSPVAPVSAKYGDVIELPASLKDGSHFKGWYLNGAEVSNSYTVTDSVTLTAVFTEISLDADTVKENIDEIIAGAVDGEGNLLSGVCYTAASLAAYHDAKAQAEAFAGKPATAENAAAYEQALADLRTAVAGLTVEHDYSGAPVVDLAPAYDPATGTYTDGRKEYACENDDAHVRKTVVVKAADYQKADGYQALYDDIALLPDGEDLTEEAKQAAEAIREALENISKNFDESNQDALDAAAAALKAELDSFKETYLAKDGDAFATDETGKYTPSDAALKADFTDLEAAAAQTAVTDEQKKYGDADKLAAYNDALAAANEVLGHKDDDPAKTKAQYQQTIDDAAAALRAAYDALAATVDTDRYQDALDAIVNSTDPTGADNKDAFDAAVEAAAAAIADPDSTREALEQAIADVQAAADALTYTADTAALEAAIARANAAAAAGVYTDASLAALTETLADAETALANAQSNQHTDKATRDALQTAVDAAAAALNEALAGLTKKGADYSEYDALMEKIDALKDNDALADDLLAQVNRRSDNPLPRDLTVEDQQTVDDEAAAIRALLDQILEKDGDAYTDTVKDSALAHVTVTFRWTTDEGTATDVQTLVKHESAAAPEVPACFGTEDDAKHFVFGGWDKAFADVTADLTVTAIYTAEAHSGAWTVVTAPTEDADGIAEMACGVCGGVFTKTIPAFDENSPQYRAAVTKAATCKEEGVMTYTWVGSDEVSFTRPIEKTRHQWGAWVVTVPATEETDGEAERTCRICGDKEYDAAINVAPAAVTYVKFHNIARMHYILYAANGETYAVYDSSTVEWRSPRALKFSVYTYSNFGYPDVIVYADGQELTPDAEGKYTIPATGGRVTITAAGAIRDDSVPGGKLSFWELLLRFIRRIIAFFTGKNNG